MANTSAIRQQAAHTYHLPTELSSPSCEQEPYEKAKLLMKNILELSGKPDIIPWQHNFLFALLLDQTLQLLLLIFPEGCDLTPAHNRVL